jgi:hypothetical protein
MRGSIANSAEASELRGDTTDSRRSRRPKRSSDSNGNDSVIDIDESDIRPVNPKRRPRPSGDNNGDRPRNRNSESDNLGNNESTKDTAASGRRRRPSSRPSPYSNTEASDTDDF